MIQRKHEFVEGEFYHLYNRGNSKQKIFLDIQDKDRFSKLLYLHNSLKNINFRDDIVERGIDAWDFDRGEPIVSIGAWVLMSNHFHIYITIPPAPMSSVGENGVENIKENAVSLFMRKVLTSYVKYFNKKYEHAGNLFESNFKSTLVDTDEYAKYLFSYINLNPVKVIDPEWKEKGIKDVQKAKDFLKNYQWSSYQDYIGINRVQRKILTTKDFPEYFTNVKIFEREIFEWLLFTSPKSDIGQRHRVNDKSYFKRSG